MCLFRKLANLLKAMGYTLISGEEYCIVGIVHVILTRLTLKNLYEVTQVVTGPTEFQKQVLLTLKSLLFLICQIVLGKTISFP